ncbi:MAG: HesA/MoeB/ThiF family protein [Hyphomicrobiales bacterium]
MSRYARQEILSEFGTEGQNRLVDAHILVVGAGGLACPALQYLVGAGIGEITIVDHDVISLSNLHRQTLYREDQVGFSKAQMAVLALSKLNADCKLCPVVSTLNPSNVAELVKQADIILDCADSFAVSYILSDECMAQNRPLISASALEFSGYVGGFCGEKPSLRAVFPDLPSRAATCATSGILGSVVGTIGAMQAQMAIAHIVGITPSPLGQLVSLDLKNYRFGGFRFDQAPEPEQNILRFISETSLLKDDFIVELRGLDEAPKAIKPNALRHNISQFEQKQPLPQTNQRAVLCCHSGLRAWQAARHLQNYWDGEISLIATSYTH